MSADERRAAADTGSEMGPRTTRRTELASFGRTAVIGRGNPDRSGVALGLLLAVGVVLGTRGPSGLVGAALLLVGWAVLDTVLLFGLGQIVIAATIGDSAGLPALALVEAAVFGLLTRPSLSDAEPLTFLIAFVVALVGLGAVAWSALALSGSLVAGMLVVGAVTAAVAYYLHRFGRVVAGRYGTVSDDD